MKSNKIWLIVAILLTVTACAHNPQVVGTKAGEPGTPVVVNEAEDKLIHELPGPQTPAAATNEIGTIPLEVNGEVEKWIQYFQGRGRGYFERYLERSAKYAPLMKKVLRDNGVPEDLIYICMIESGFSSKIKSKAKAVGFWQFIKGTGNHYGLINNKLMDERYDPVRSTEAAAAYFKGLYNLFNSWFLAIASYNVGENRIKNLVMKNYTRDFWELAKRKQLPAETIQYIPKFLAAGLIAREPEKYGFVGLNYQTAMVFDTVTARETIDMRALAKNMKADYEEIRDLNPSYKTQYAPVISGEAQVRVPLGTKDLANNVMPNALVKNKRIVAEVDDVNSKNSFLRYKVQKGETLEKIAERFDVSVDSITKLNRVRRRRSLRPGTTLKIPSSAAMTKPQAHKTGDKVVAAAIKAEVPANSGEKKESLLHVVKRGETLTRIASKHNLSVASLAKANGLRWDQKVLLGQKITIPQD